MEERNGLSYLRTCPKHIEPYHISKKNWDYKVNSYNAQELKAKRDIKKLYILQNINDKITLSPMRKFIPPEQQTHGGPFEQLVRTLA